jgi:hypothetical protein
VLAKEGSMPYLSVKVVWSLIQCRIQKQAGSMSTKATSISKDMDVAKHLSKLHNRYVIVPAYNAPNNIVFVCKKHYIDCLIKVLDVNN